MDDEMARCYQIGRGVEKRTGIKFSDIYIDVAREITHFIFRYNNATFSVGLGKYDTEEIPQSETVAILAKAINCEIEEIS